MPEKIIIKLTKTENEIIQFFRQNKTIWKAMKLLKPGSIELHFDENNEYQKKDLHIYELKKRPRA